MTFIIYLVYKGKKITGYCNNNKKLIIIIIKKKTGEGKTKPTNELH